MVQPLWSAVCRFLKKLKIELPYDSASPHLDIYSEKNMVQKNAGSPMFMAALFAIAKTWKQPTCPSTDEWIKNLWHIYTHFTHITEYILFSYKKGEKNESVLMR